MAIQIRCFKCDRQFLLRSDNTVDLPIEFDNRKLEITCPHCGYINYEFVLTVETRFDRVLTPVQHRLVQTQGNEHQEVINFDQTDAEFADDGEDWTDVDQMVFDFCQDYLLEDSTKYRRIPVLDDQGRATGVYKILGQPSPAVYERIFKPDKCRDSAVNTLGPDQCPGDTQDEELENEPADVGGIFGGVTMPEKQ